MSAARLAARLRAISGADEDWIAGLADSRTPAACHALLARCLASPGANESAELDEVRALTLAERDWLLLQLHQRSFGGDVVGEVHCPACRSLNEIRFAAREVFDTPDDAADRVEVPLPSGATAVVRTVTAADHEHFAALAGLDADAQQRVALARLVVSTGEDGVSPAHLDSEDRRALARAIETTVPEPVRLDLACHQCEARFDAPFDPGRFLLAELAAHSRTLLDDVHTLAMTYHWSEPDVLRLPIGRRLAYLERIEADRDRSLIRQEAWR
jgi:hypothetical protein